MRHLEYAGALPLPGSFRAEAGRGFVVPEGVLGELARRRVPAEISAFLADGTARTGRCGEGRAALLARLLEDVGRGEAEAICIVDECEDRTFRKYVILTGGRAAQAEAGSRGMISLGVMEFLLLANREGLLTAGGAAAALASLEASGCRPGGGGHGRFMRSLR